jgi:hypothetical protein
MASTMEANAEPPAKSGGAASGDQRDSVTATHGTKVGAHTESTVYGQEDGGVCVFKCGAVQSTCWYAPDANGVLAAAAGNIRLRAGGKVCCGCYFKTMSAHGVAHKSPDRSTLFERIGALFVVSRVLFSSPWTQSDFQLGL